MKKIVKALSVFMCLALICTSFAGCKKGPTAEMTEENITATVEVAVQALKDFKPEDLNKYIDSGTLSTIMSYVEKKQQFQELGQAIFKNLKVEIKSIDIENQTVTISCTNKDLTDVANNFVNQLNAEYPGAKKIQLLSKLNNDSWLDRKLGGLVSDIDGARMMPRPKDAVLKIEATKENLVLVFDSEGEDAVSGGAISTISGGLGM